MSRTDRLALLKKLLDDGAISDKVLEDFLERTMLLASIESSNYIVRSEQERSRRDKIAAGLFPFIYGEIETFTNMCNDYAYTWKPIMTFKLLPFFHLHHDRGLACERITSLKMKVGTIDHLLDFAIAYPEAQLHKQIIALGSADECGYFPYLWDRDGRRELGSMPYDELMDRYCWFLAYLEE